MFLQLSDLLSFFLFLQHIMEYKSFCTNINCILQFLMVWGSLKFKIGEIGFFRLEDHLRGSKVQDEQPPRMYARSTSLQASLGQSHSGIALERLLVVLEQQTCKLDLLLTPVNTTLTIRFNDFGHGRSQNMLRPNTRYIKDKYDFLNCYGVSLILSQR